MLFVVPPISKEVMQALREDETSPAVLLERFEQAQPNVANGLKSVLGNGDEYEAVISSMDLMCRAVALEIERRLS